LNTETDGVPAPTQVKRVHFPDDLVTENRVVARLKRSLHGTLEAKEEDRILMDVDEVIGPNSQVIGTGVLRKRRTKKD
jgi:hypothetical protein